MHNFYTKFRFASKVTRQADTGGAAGGGAAGGGDSGAGGTGGTGGDSGTGGGQGAGQNGAGQNGAGDSSADPFNQAVSAIAQGQARAQQAQQQAQQAQQPQPPNPQQAITQLQQQIRAMTLPQGVIDNVDYNDPRAVAEMQQNIHRASVAASIQTFAPIMAQVLNAQKAEMMQQIQAMIAQTTTRTSQETELANAFPLINDQTHGPLFQQMRSSISHLPVAEQVKSLKAIAARLQLNATPNQPSAPSGFQAPGSLPMSGAELLDSMFPELGQG